MAYKASTINWTCPYCGGRCYVNDEHTRTRRKTTQYYHLLCAFPHLTPQGVREVGATKEGK